MDVDLRSGTDRVDLGDPYAELTPISVVSIALLLTWLLIPDLGDFRLSAGSYVHVAWFALLVVGYPFTRRWIFSPRWWYAEFTATELRVRYLWTTFSVPYPSIEDVSLHTPAWRRRLGEFRALFKRQELPACFQLQLRSPIRRTPFSRTNRLVLRPNHTDLFMQTLRRRAAADH